MKQKMRVIENRQTGNRLRAIGMRAAIQASR